MVLIEDAGAEKAIASMVRYGACHDLLQRRLIECTFPMRVTVPLFRNVSLILETHVTGRINPISILV